MFKFIMSFVVSITVLVVFSEWIFERFPVSREVWETIKAQVVNTYDTQGWEGVLILAVLGVGVYKMIDR